MKRQLLFFLKKSLLLLFYAFFQPLRFRQDFDSYGLFNLRRSLLFLQLLVPLFLFTFLTTCLLQLVRLLLGNELSGLALLSLLGPTCLLVAIGLLCGLLLSTIESTLLGIMAGVALAIASALSFTINSDMSVNSLLSTSTAIHPQMGFLFAIIAGMLFGLTESSTISIGSFIAYGIALGLAKDLLYGLMGGCALGIAGSTVLNLTQPRRGTNFLVNGILGGLVGFILWFGLTDLIEFLQGVSSTNDASLISGIFFLFSYLLGYYRIPLYPISAISGLLAYQASSIPTKLFPALLHSALYWDERMYLPFPRLKELLMMGIAQDYRATSDIVDFILAERPQQSFAVQQCLIEMAIGELEKLETLRDIASSRPKLTHILAQVTNVVASEDEAPFTYLVDARLNARRYANLYSWQARHDALQDMLTSLKKIHARNAFESNDHNGRLKKVIHRWTEVIEHEVDELDRAPQESGHIYNPYNPGPVLKLGDTLFVGRHDLALKLGEALNMGSRRPTFLLKGERRMGKSSTLKQLPSLLGARHLPVYYDLQSPSLFASTQSFFSTIAREIYEVLHSRGISVKKLGKYMLSEAPNSNDSSVYEVFDNWLDSIEARLKQEDRILLLALDEFEQLEEAGRIQHFPLTLLFNWFRNCIQQRSHIALLFSGVRSFSEMGKNWAQFFVNVQTLKVSFLRHDEAYQLITRPIPDFPGEQIFGKHIAEEIIRVTGCHPFMIQALCAALIDILNTNASEHIDEHDIMLGVQQVFKNWGDGYFRDLWERTSPQEQICLRILKKMNRGNLVRIEHQWEESTKTVRATLETLQKRDLVVLEGDYYRIAAPIFSEWVELYS